MAAQSLFYSTTGPAHLSGVKDLVLLLHQALVVMPQAVQAVDQQLLGSSSYQVLIMVSQQQADVAQQRKVTADIFVVLINHLHIMAAGTAVAEAVAAAAKTARKVCT